MNTWMFTNADKAIEVIEYYKKNTAEADRYIIEGDLFVNYNRMSKAEQIKVDAFLLKDIGEYFFIDMLASYIRLDAAYPVLHSKFLKTRSRGKAAYAIACWRISRDKEIEKWIIEATRVSIPSNPIAAVSSGILNLIHMLGEMKTDDSILRLTELTHSENNLIAGIATRYLNELIPENPS